MTTTKEAGMGITTTQGREAGVLDGFEFTCPECGDTLASSLKSALQIDAERHLAWHEREGR